MKSINYSILRYCSLNYKNASILRKKKSTLKRQDFNTLLVKFTPKSRSNLRNKMQSHLCIAYSVIVGRLKDVRSYYSPENNSLLPFRYIIPRDEEFC